MRIAVLGCGPAGLLAAHVASRAGHDVSILSEGEQSQLYGCQYLHGPLPGIELRSARVTYQLHGTAEGYRRKVYGDTWTGRVSPEDLVGDHTAWDIRQAYGTLWDLYGGLVRPVTVNPAVVQRLIRSHDMVISSIPARFLCEQREVHFFLTRSIWADGSAPGKPVAEIPDDTIICDGTRDVSWYRVSRVFGHSTVEWPIPGQGGVRVKKPLATNCNCFQEVVRVGRYGAWDKSRLVHHTVAEVSRALGQAGSGD